MISLPHNDQLNLGENDAPTDGSTSFPLDWDAFFCLSSDSPSESMSTLNKNDSPIRPATRAASLQPTESSEMIMLGDFYDGGTSDYSLEDLPSCNYIGGNKNTPDFPFTVVPGLLQGHTNVVPSSSPPSKSEEAESPQVDKDTNESQDVVQQYAALQKGKGEASADKDFFLGSRVVGIPNLELDSDATPGGHPSIEEWVRGNRPILQHYADRQISLPVGERLEVKKPSQSILAAFKLLVSRDQEDYVEPSRRIGPQLIENFAEIDHWAKEYVRSRHARVVDSKITSLLTVVINNFYEAQVQLIDGLVMRALENMRTGGRSSLSLGDFAIGFDFQMSQDLPFYVGKSLSKFREPRPIRVREVGSTSEPVTTTPGRQVKPSRRAQQASETTGDDRRNEENETLGFQVKERQTVNGSVTATCQKKSTTKPSSNHNVTETLEDVAKPPPPNTAAVYLKYRPTMPSNLGQSSILSFSPPTIATTPARSGNNPESAPCSSASADGPSNSCPSRSNITLQSSPRLTLRLRVPSIVGTTTDSGPTSTKSDDLIAIASNSEMAPGGRGASEARRGRSRGPRNGGRGRGSRNVTVTPNAVNELPEATLRPDSAHILPTTHPVGVGAATFNAAFNGTKVFRKVFLPLTGAAGTTASHGAGLPEARDNTDTRNENVSTSQSTRTGRSLALVADPGHPQGKKRKLDDCDN